MSVGVTLRTMGPQSTRELFGECAKIADGAGLDSLWVADHIAIPPGDSACVLKPDHREPSSAAL